jgi:hypothetical protein
VMKERSNKLPAVRQATLRLSLSAGFLKKREKWRTPSYYVSMLKNKPALYFPLMWPTRQSPDCLSHALNWGRR